MAVTLISDDLLQPAGELDESLFPADNCNDFVAGWLSQAADKVLASANITAADQDKAAAAWVYYRAYTWVANRIANTPESVTVGPRTERSSATQQKYFADLAAFWLEQYYGFDTATVASGIPAFFSTVKARRNCGIGY